MLPDRPVLRRSELDALPAWIEAARTDGAIAFIDKAEEWTSFDVVAKLRSLIRVKRVGHAGTLDPLATGLLVVCCGRATKDIAQIQDADKEYVVTVRFGATTETDDRGSAEQIRTNDVHIDRDVLEKIISERFLGSITQIPPSYAAIRHNGRRQYDLAREGKDFIPRPRHVDVFRISVDAIHGQNVTMTIACSKGTYIRSLARDIGEALGYGGYVWDLRRTKIGDINVDDAVSMQDVITRVQQQQSDNGVAA